MILPLPASATSGFSHRWKGADDYELEISSFLGLSRLSTAYVINVCKMAHDSPQFRLNQINEERGNLSM